MIAKQPRIPVALHEGCYAEPTPLVSLHRLLAPYMEVEMAA